MPPLFGVLLCVRTDSQRRFYNQRGKLAGEYGNMVASNLTSYTQAQKRYLNSFITDAWNTLKGISGLVEQIVPEYTQDSLNGYLDQLNLQNRDYMIEYVTPAGVGEKVKGPAGVGT